MILTDDNRCDNIDVTIQRFVTKYYRFAND